MLLTLALPFVLYAAVCLVVYVLQARLVYLPDRQRPVPPPTGEVAEVELVAEDGVRLLAWSLVPDRPRGALLFLHGNAGNIESRLPVGRAFRELGLAVLLLDYRGYGGSEGTPTEVGTYLDAEAAYDWLAAAGSGPIAVFGESLGCGIALELARRRDVTALVLENGFTSIADVGRKAYPWLPVRLLARIRYDNLSKIGAITAPILLVHSPSDQIVPFAHAERLQRAAPPGTDLLVTSGGHNDGGFLRRSEWTLAVARFLQRGLEGSRTR